MSKYKILLILFYHLFIYNTIYFNIFKIKTNCNDSDIFIWQLGQAVKVIVLMKQYVPILKIKKIKNYYC